MLNRILSDTRILPFVFPLIATALGVLLGYAALHAQDIDAPSKPGECAVYFIAREQHSNTYQMTCSDPQPDAITIEHAATDSQKVYTARTH